MSETNVLKHELVPEHYLLEPEEKKKVLKELGLPANKLPRILVHDPTIRLLEMSRGEEIPRGSVVRIRRESTTAGVITSYRVVVDS